MKHCPQCNRTYTDDSLSFCLDDGALLSRNEEATVPYGSATSGYSAPPTEILEPNPGLTSRSAPPVSSRRVQTAQSSHRALTAAVISIALLLLVIAGLGVIFLLRQKQPPTSGTQGVTSPLPISSNASATTIQSKTGLEDFELPKSRPLEISVTASSVRYSVQSNTYDPANIIDGARKTAWIEGVDGPGLGEWLKFNFDREIDLHRILILPGYFKSTDIWKGNNRLAAAKFYFSDGSSRFFNFPDRMERQTLDVGSVKTHWVRLEISDVYYGTDPDTAISEVAFEWEP
jgi:F5/8 type C domain-containing protein